MNQSERESRERPRRATERTQHHRGGIKRHKCGGGYRIIRKKIPR